MNITGLISDFNNFISHVLIMAHILQMAKPGPGSMLTNLLTIPTDKNMELLGLGVWVSDRFKQSKNQSIIPQATFLASSGAQKEFTSKSNW